MKEISGVLKNLFEKLSDFFDILDLSFLVSGAAIFFSLLSYLHFTKVEIPFHLSESSKIVFVLLSYYSLGLICFAAGRRFRTGKAPDRKTE